jgi:hypothetical protein
MSEDDDSGPRERVPPFDPPAPQVPEEDLEAALSKTVKRKLLPDGPMREAVVIYARKKSAKLLVDEKYDQAHDTDEAIAFIIAAMRREEIIQDTNEQNQVLQDRLSVCRDNEVGLVDTKRDVLDRTRATAQTKMEALLQQQETERTEFEREWSSPEAQIPFRKPSVTLLQIRQQQKSLALVHDFRSAKAMRIQAAAYEKREANEATARFEQAMRIAYEQLLEKQEKERQCLTENRELIRAVRTRERDHELSCNELSRKSLELRIAIPKHMKRPTIHIPVSKAHRASSIGGYAMMTQRTRSELATYRRAADLQRLQLSPSPARILGKKKRPATAFGHGD